MNTPVPRLSVAGERGEREQHVLAAVPLGRSLGQPAAPSEAAETVGFAVFDAAEQIAYTPVRVNGRKAASLSVREYE